MWTAGADDAALVGVAGWASFAAARRIAEWVALPRQAPAARLS